MLTGAVEVYASHALSSSVRSIGRSLVIAGALTRAYALGNGGGMTTMELRLGNRRLTLVLLLAGLVGVVALMATTHVGSSAAHGTHTSAEGDPPTLRP